MFTDLSLLLMILENLVYTTFCELFLEIRWGLLSDSYFLT